MKFMCVCLFSFSKVAIYNLPLFLILKTYTFENKLYFLYLHTYVTLIVPSLIAYYIYMRYFLHGNKLFFTKPKPSCASNKT